MTRTRSSPANMNDSAEFDSEISKTLSIISSTTGARRANTVNIKWPRASNQWHVPSWAEDPYSVGERGVACCSLACKSTRPTAIEEPKAAVIGTTEPVPDLNKYVIKHSQSTNACAPNPDITAVRMRNSSSLAVAFQTVMITKHPSSAR